jgi:hypothetical protein
MKTYTHQTMFIFNCCECRISSLGSLKNGLDPRCLNNECGDKWWNRGTLADAIVMPLRIQAPRVKS